MSDWQQETVWNLQQAGVLLVEDGNHGEYRPRKEEFCEDGCPFIRPPDLIGGRVDFKNSEMINEVAVNRVRKGKGQPGDILFSHRATVGRMARVGLNDPAFVANPGVTIYRCLDEDVLDRSFLYFSMQHSVFMDQVWAVAGSTDTFPYASLTEQRKFLLQLPPIEEQREIAAVLGALDDKIELNRKTASNLEAMARALYRSWFVDFDPVAAKSEGRAPAHMPPTTAALFPDRFGDDGLPEGWRAASLGDELVILDSKRVPLSKNQRLQRQGNIPYYGATSIMDFVDEALFDEVLLLVGEDGSVERPDGKPFTQYIWGKAWVNNHAHVLKGRRLSVEQLKCIFDEVDIAPFVTGAVQAKLSQGNMKKIPFVSADERVHTAFDLEIQPWFERLRWVAEENQTLATLRDTLLPRLMSGELRVGDARDLLEEVA